MATRAVSTVAYYRAWDTSANTPKTGDSANHTLRWVKDGTSSATTNSPSEVDSTNAPGLYKVTLTSTETDCTYGTLTGKSSTSNVYIFGVQIGFEYVPTSSATFGAFIGNATAALAVDASGRVDVSKIAGTSQTGRDIGASVLISSGSGSGQLDVTSGVIKANLAQILGTALTETAGQIAAGFKQFFNIASPTSTMNTITAVTTATNVTTVNGLANNVITAASINASALNGKGDWNVGKTGYSLSSAGVQAIWDALTSALTTAGSIGKLLVDNINATIGSRSTLTAGQVNAEVVDALATDTYAEPGQGAPAATASLADKINYLFKAWRNRTTQTSSAYSLYADDAATVDQKAAVSDDGTTFDRGEIASGP